MIQSLTKIATIFYLCVFLSPSLYGQNQKTEVKDLKNILTVLFDGMREGDSAKVASVFDPSVQMYTSFIDKNRKQVVKQGDLNSFLIAIGTPHGEVWDERLENIHIKFDDGIAQIWTDYSFYIGSEFSHCGVDAFHLIKTPTEEWKIIHLMDTRKSHCENNLKE